MSNLDQRQNFQYFDEFVNASDVNIHSLRSTVNSARIHRTLCKYVYKIILHRILHTYSIAVGKYVPVYSLTFNCPDMYAIVFESP